MTRKTLTTGLLLTLALPACSEGVGDPMYGDAATLDPDEMDDERDAEEADEDDVDVDENDDDGADPVDEDPADEDPADEDPADEDPMDEDPADEDPVDEDPEDEDPELPPQAEEDGDSSLAPAVLARFRATSPAPISVDAPLFNEDPIDTKGLQYENAISVPGDDADVLQFDLVPGEVDPTFRFTLECDQDEPGRVFADIYGPDGLIDTIPCGDENVGVLFENASSTDDYQVEIRLSDGDPLYVNYTLSINGFCFQSCNYSPYAG